MLAASEKAVGAKIFIQNNFTHEARAVGRRDEEEQVNLDAGIGANLVLLHASYLLIIIFKAFYNCKPEAVREEEENISQTC
jgi:hypothetical protein